MKVTFETKNIIALPSDHALVPDTISIVDSLGHRQTRPMTIVTVVSYAFFFWTSYERRFHDVYNFSRGTDKRKRLTDRHCGIAILFDKYWKSDFRLQLIDFRH